MDGIDERRTARLLLRRPTADDGEYYLRLFTDPAVMATLGGLRSPDDNARVFSQLLAHWNAHGFGLWLAFDAVSGDFLGRGGVRQMPDQAELELAYAFVPEAWGRGLATELAQESVRVAFEILGRADVICFTLPTNRASQRVMEKTGFVYEREGTYAGLPHVFYRLTAERWRAVHF